MADFLFNHYDDVEIPLNCTLIPHTSTSEIKKMLEFLIDNIFVVVGGQVFEQSVGIPMGTNYAPLLADLFCIHM
jgi:hypothetical protein